MKVEQCPDHQTLAKLLIGGIPDPTWSELWQHLDQCEECAGQLQQINVSDSLTSALRARVALGNDQDRVEVEQVIARVTQRLLAGETRSGEETMATADETSSDSRTGHAGLLAPPQRDDEIGRLGGYRVLEVLGEGGMGVVFKAEDEKLERWVALKAMKPAVSAGSSFKERFLREAKATAAIEHHNIVPIYQVGEDRGIPFIAMQFLQGESLSARLNRQEQLSESDVIWIGRDVARGLQAAHDNELIHRDIKPDNIWLDAKTGLAKILDFGLVRCADNDAGLTHTGTIMGTPRYMAPEQAQGGAVDHRSDLFSLGSVLYHLVSGQTPFEGSNLTAMLIAVAQAEPRDLTSLAPNVNPRLAKLIMQLLEKDPARRPQTAAEVVETLQTIDEQSNGQVSDTEQVETPSIDIGITPESSVVSRIRKTGRKTSSSPRSPDKAPQVVSTWFGGAGRRRTGAVVAAAGFAALILVAAIVFRFKTADGTVVVELSGPIDVASVEIDKRRVDFSADGEHRLSFHVDPGKHSLTLKTSDGVELTTTLAEKPLAVRAGQEIELRAWLERDSAHAGTRSKKTAHPRPTGTPRASNGPSSALAARANTKSESLPLLPDVARHEDSPKPSLAQLGTWRPGTTVRMSEAYPGGTPVGAPTFPGLALRPAKFKGVRRWNLETRSPRGTVNSVVFSPDGSRVALCCDPGSVRVYDTQTLQLVRLLPTLQQVATVSFVDNTTVSVSTLRNLLIWKLDGTLIAHESTSDAHAFSPDGSRCISSSGNVSHLRDSVGKPIRTLIKQERQLYVRTVGSFAWSPDSRLVAAVYSDDKLRIWDRDGRLVQEIAGSPSQHHHANSVVWSPDGQSIGVIDGNEAGTIRRYRTTGEEEAPIRIAECRNMVRFSWTPDGKSIIATGDNRLIKVNLATGEVVRRGEPSIHFGDFAISRDGNQIATLSPHFALLDRDFNTLTEIPRVRQVSHASAWWSPDGRTLATFGPHLAVELWSEDGRFLKRIHQWTANRALFAWRPESSQLALRPWPERHLLIGEVDGELTKLPVGDCHGVWYSPSGRYLLTMCWDRDSYVLQLRDARGRERKEILRSTGRPSVAFQWPHDRLAIGLGNELWTCDEADGWKTHQVQVPAGFSVAGTFNWSPNGDRLICNGTVYEYSNDELKMLAKLSRSVNYDWSPDGAKLAYAYGWDCGLFDASTGKPVKRIDSCAAIAGVASVCWHPRRNVFITSLFEGTFVCWDGLAIEPYWIAVPLPEGHSVTITAAGQILDGDRAAIEKHLVYYIENEDGSIDMLTPSDFEKRIGESVFVSDP